MAAPTKDAPSAGGFLIAMGAIAGTIVGLAIGQVTAGFLIGLGTGSAIAIAMWLRSRG